MFKINLLLLLLTGMACSTTRPIRTDKTDYRPLIEEESHLHDYQIRTVDDQLFVVRDIHFGIEELKWNNQPDALYTDHIPYTKLKDLRYINYRKVALIGFTGGFGIGFMLSLIGDSGGGGTYNLRLCPEMCLVTGAVTGVVSGTIGFARGHKTVYRPE